MDRQAIEALFGAPPPPPPPERVMDLPKMGGVLPSTVRLSNIARKLAGRSGVGSGGGGGAWVLLKNSNFGAFGGLTSGTL